MKVIKFGGTSVGSANSILSVKRIVEAINEPLIVVVSALGGITDKLINTSKMAAAGDSSYENEFREIVYRHVEMIKEVIPAGEAQVSLQRRVGELLNELKDIFQGIYLIKDLSPKTSDTIVSYGERLSSIIAAQLTGAEKFKLTFNADTVLFVRNGLIRAGSSKRRRNIPSMYWIRSLLLPWCARHSRICPDGCWFRDLSLRIRLRAR